MLSSKWYVTLNLQDSGIIEKQWPESEVVGVCSGKIFAGHDRAVVHVNSHRCDSVHKSKPAEIPAYGGKVHKVPPSLPEALLSADGCSGGLSQLPSGIRPLSGYPCLSYMHIQMVLSSLGGLKTGAQDLGREDLRGWVRER